MSRMFLLLLLAIAVGLPAGSGTAHAQVQRHATNQIANPPGPQAVEAMVNPLKGRVEQLEQEVKRLEAALESLRLTVKANQQNYAQHKHQVPGFGVTSAKTIYPGTPASDGTLLAFTCPSCSKTALSGPPQ